MIKNKVVRLTKRPNGFPSKETWLNTIVAIMWGFVDGETISLRQFLATAIILVGVFLANKKKSS